VTIDTDFHSHVSRSSAYHMVQSAQEKGLRILGLSEHIFQMSEVRQRPLLEHLSLEGPLMTFAEYGDTVRAAGQQGKCETRLGLEVDFIPEKNEEIWASLQALEWDFLIGSVHEVDGLYFERPHQWSREEGEALWLRYFAVLRETTACGMFSVVSHPLRMRAENAFLPPALDDELERMAAEATRCNVALEINGYDVLHYPGLVRRLARACALHETPVSVGSDAHNPRQVAQAHAQTEEILREAGISKLRIWRHREPEEYSI
jgi:histidinol-phosphatase (PHP family)